MKRKYTYQKAYHNAFNVQWPKNQDKSCNPHYSTFLLLTHMINILLAFFED